MSFYALDSEGIDAVARFVADGWDRDECVVVVATEQHREEVTELLAQRGYDPAARTEHGRYLALDAEATLQQIMVDGTIDPDRFLLRANEVIAQASSAGVPIRAFGEMVSQLWQNGLLEPAIELELLWNQLLRAHDFTLLCAYPTGAFEHAELVDVRRVCELHTDLLAPSAVWEEGGVVEAGHACSRVYLPIPESVPAARHFVVDVLRSWGHGELAPDAALIVSELATNALRHADSPFAPSSTGAAEGCGSASRTPRRPRWSGARSPSTTSAAAVRTSSRRWPSGGDPAPCRAARWSGPS